MWFFFQDFLSSFHYIHSNRKNATFAYENDLSSFVYLYNKNIGKEWKKEKKIGIQKDECDELCSYVAKFT